MALLKNSLIVANTGSDSLTLIDLKTHCVINTIYLDTEKNGENLESSISDGPCIGPHQIVYDGNRSLYSVNSYNNSVFKINMLNNKIEDTVFVGSFPSHMKINDSHIYVTNSDSNSISVIDEIEFKIIGTMSVGERPHDIKVDKDNNTIYVANNNDYSISIIDLKSGYENKIKLQYNPLHLLIKGNIMLILCQPSNGKLCSNVLILDITTNMVIRNIEIPGFIFDMAIHEQKNCIYVTNAEDGYLYEIDIYIGEIINKQFIGGVPNNIAINNTEIFVSDVIENKLTVVDIKHGEVVDEIYVGLEPNTLTIV